MTGIVYAISVERKIKFTMLLYNVKIIDNNE